MLNFAIDPQDCLILKAFRDSNSLREAAALLQCDPAGLARRVQRISQEHGFLHKSKNRWQLTSKGLDLVTWAEASIDSQRKILTNKSQLRMGTTSWLSESVVIPHLHLLKKRLAETTSFSMSVPKKSFEQTLKEGSIDFAVVCHPPESPDIAHKQLAAEEWTIIAPAAWKKYLKSHQQKNLSGLLQKPFIQHRGMNRDLFLPSFTEEHIESSLEIDHLIGVRAAVSAGLGWSLVPRLLITSANEKILEVSSEALIRDRKVCLWWLRSQIHNRQLEPQISSWLKEIILERS